MYEKDTCWVLSIFSSSLEKKETTTLTNPYGTLQDPGGFQPQETVVQQHSLQVIRHSIPQTKPCLLSVWELGSGTHASPRTPSEFRTVPVRSSRPIFSYFGWELLNGLMKCHRLAILDDYDWVGAMKAGVHGPSSWKLIYELLLRKKKTRIIFQHLIWNLCLSDKLDSDPPLIKDTVPR